MQRNVVIIGNAGAARECRWILEEAGKQDASLAFKGYLAFEGYAGDLREQAQCSLDNDDDYCPEAGDVFVIGIGDPGLRQRAFAKWKARGASFLNLIHPYTSIHASVRMGEANIIACACFLAPGVDLGNANYLNGDNTFGHDCRVGDANFFGPGAMLLGNVTVGNANAFGVRSVVLAKARVGDGNVLAPGAYVYKGCRDGKTMTGNPALDVSE